LDSIGGGRSCLLVGEGAGVGRFVGGVSNRAKSINNKNK